MQLQTNVSVCLKLRTYNSCEYKSHAANNKCTCFASAARIEFKQVVDEIFSLKDRQKSLDLIDSYSKFWMQVIGTRLNVGKKTVNASTKFSELFEEV